MPEMQEHFPANAMDGGLSRPSMASGAAHGLPWPSRHLGSCPADMPEMQEHFSASSEMEERGQQQDRDFLTRINADQGG